MPHVDLAAGVGEHLQHVVFGPAVGGHVFDGEAAALGPGLLPARLGLGEVVAQIVGRGIVHDAVCIVQMAAAASIARRDRLGEDALAAGHRLGAQLAGAGEDPALDLADGAG